MSFQSDEDTASLRSDTEAWDSLKTNYNRKEPRHIHSFCSFLDHIKPRDVVSKHCEIIIKCFLSSLHKQEHPAADQNYNLHDKRERTEEILSLTEAKPPSYLNPEILATSITDVDRAGFLPLCANDFISPNTTRVDDLTTQWLALADDVKACVIADSELVQTINEVVEIWPRLSVLVYD